MKNKRNDRKKWFVCLKQFLKLFIKKPKFHFVGNEIEDGSLIISNHVGAKVPLSMEIYFTKNFRFWGTHEMNGNLKSVYKYLSFTYFHQKKHWNLFLSRLFCLIAAPFAKLFYRGLRLIPTYQDARLKSTLNQSVETLEKNHCLLVFPEDSSKGYFDEIQKFFPGFVLLAKTLLKKGIDRPCYLMYFLKKQRTFVVDKPFMISQLLNGENKNTIAERLRIRLNELSKILPNKTSTESNI